MEFIDGHAVVSHRIRFRGRAEVEPDQATHITDGRLVVWLVVSRSQPPSFHPTEKDGEDRYRFAIQNVEKAVPVPEGAVRDSAIIYMNSGNDQGYLAFEAPHQTPLGFVDPATDQWHEHSPIIAERETGRLARFLHENFLIDADENSTAVDIAIKMLSQTSTWELDYDETDAIRAELVDDGVATIIDVPLPDEDVVPGGGLTFEAPGEIEHVGSIYGPKYQGKNRALIDGAFDE